MNELTDEQVLKIWNETYVQRGETGLDFARAVIAADRALRESSYTEQDVNGILNACSGAYYPMALEAVVRRTLGVPAP